MIKIITLLLCIGALVLIFVSNRRKSNKDCNNDIDLSVQCDSCKTYISSKEAIIANKKYYCSKECLK